MALKYKAPVVFGYTLRGKDNRHTVIAEGPLDLVRTGDDEIRRYTDGTQGGHGVLRRFGLDLATRTSKLYSAPGLSQIYGLHGVVKFRPITGNDTSFSLSVQFQGESVFDQTLDMTLAAAEAGAVFGGSDYFGDGSVFGNHFEGRLAWERFTVAGQGNEIQFVTASVGTESFQINEIYAGFRAAG